MALGMLLMDLLYFSALGGLLAWAGWVGSRAWSAAVHLGTPLAVAATGLSAIGAWLGAALLLALLLPRPRPGRHKVMGSPQFYFWFLRFFARRFVDFPPLGALVGQSNLLRFLFLRAFGARASFSSSMSSDAMAFDPALLTLGPGAMVGSRSIVSGHYIVRDQLVLGRVEIGAGALLAVRCVVGPGVTIGARTVVLGDVAIAPDTTIGAGCVVGGGARISKGCVIGDGAKVAEMAYLPPRTVVAPGATWTREDGQRASEAAHSEADPD